MKRYDTVINLLQSGEKELNKSMHLLDIGCGPPAEHMPSGILLSHLGYGTGMDIVKHDLSHPFVLGDICSIPLQNHTFDQVVCLEVIEHIKDHNKALSEIFRILKPGGVLI